LRCTSEVDLIICGAEAAKRKPKRTLFICCADGNERESEQLQLIVLIARKNSPVCEVSDFRLALILRVSMTIRARLPHQLFELNGRYREEHRAPAVPQSSQLEWRPDKVLMMCQGNDEIETLGLGA
jgi:hypothetical protein